MIPNKEKRNAEDLKGGDVFLFREGLYVALSNFMDCRHTQTIVTAIQHGMATVFRFFRTFKVTVKHRVKINIRVVDNKQHEITQTDLDELRIQT